MKIFLQRVKQAGASNSRVALFILFTAVFIVGAALPSITIKAAAQKRAPVLVPSPVAPSPKSPASDDYYFFTSNGAAIVPGTDDTGIHCDDCTGQITAPTTKMAAKTMNSAPRELLAPACLTRWRKIFI